MHGDTVLMVACSGSVMDNAQESNPCCDSFQFVTRAIRIMEWIANMDVSGYQNHNGLNCVVKRLEVLIYVLLSLTLLTPESDQCQISPAASASILHRIVWRT